MSQLNLLNRVVVPAVTASKEEFPPSGGGSWGPEASQDAVAANGQMAETTTASPDGGEKIVMVSAGRAYADNAEDALVSVGDAADELDEASNEAYKVEQVMAGLESIYQSLVDRAGAPLSRSEAEATVLAIESYIEGGAKLCPSTESFGGHYASVAATASLEANVRETLERLQAWIVEKWKQFIAFCSEFIDRLTNACAKLEARAKALAVKINAIADGATPRKSTLNIGGLGSRLTRGGVMLPLASVVGRGLFSMACAVQVEATIATVESQAVDAAQKMKSASNEGFAAARDAAVKAYDAAVRLPSFFKQSGDTYQTEVFPGEVFFTATDKNGHWVFETSNTGKTPTQTAIRTPNVTALKQLATGCEGYGNSARAKLVQIGQRVKNDKGQRFLTAVQGPANDLSAENQGHINAFLRDCAEDVRALHSLARDMLTTSANSMLAVVSVAEMAVRQYSEAGVAERVGDAAGRAGTAVKNAVDDAKARVTPGNGAGGEPAAAE